MYLKAIFVLFMSLFIGQNLIAQYTSEPYRVGDTFLYGIDDTEYNANYFERFGDYYSLSFLSSPYSKYAYIEPVVNTYIKDKASIEFNNGNNIKYFLNHNNAGYFTVGEIINYPISESGKILKKINGEKPFLPSNKLSKNITKSYTEEIAIGKPTGLFASLLPPNVDSILIDIAAKALIEEVEECKVQVGTKVLGATKWIINHTLSTVVYYRSKRDKDWNELPRYLNKTILETAPISEFNDFKEIIFVESSTGKMLSRSIMQNNLIKKSWYLVDEKTESLKIIDAKSKEIILYPNPTYGDIKIELINYPPDYYQLEIYNIIGKVMYKKSNFDYKTNTIEDDVSFLKKGSYLFSVLDRNGKKLVTKRLVIITP